jgi:hypothetical protein
MRAAAPINPAAPIPSNPIPGIYDSRSPSLDLPVLVPVEVLVLVPVPVPVEVPVPELSRLALDGALVESGNMD